MGEFGGGGGGGGLEGGIVKSSDSNREVSSVVYIGGTKKSSKFESVEADWLLKLRSARNSLVAVSMISFTVSIDSGTTYFHPCISSRKRLDSRL